MADADGAPLVLVPVNRLDRAKGRLSALLSAAERAALALATFETVCAAVVEAGYALAVLTSDPRVAARGRALLIGEDPVRRGLNAQLEAAIAGLDSPPQLLILHADLPLATGAALRSLVAAALPAPSATLVTSADGGTNAMLLRPPGRYPLAYGAASAARHQAAATAAGVRCTAVESPPLALDLDTPADLRRLLAEPAGRETPAGRLLVEFGVDQRLGSG